MSYPTMPMSTSPDRNLRTTSDARWNQTSTFLSCAHTPTCHHDVSHYWRTSNKTICQLLLPSYVNLKRQERIKKLATTGTHFRDICNVLARIELAYWKLALLSTNSPQKDTMWQFSSLRQSCPQSQSTIPEGYISRDQQRFTWQLQWY
jgi:hypothetical protein